MDINFGRERQVIGRIGEIFVSAKLLSLNRETFIPVIDMNGCDFLIRKDSDEYVRIQVKTTCMPNPAIRWHGKSTDYDFDFVVAVVLDDKKNVYTYYVIPRDVVKNGAATMTLNPDSTYTDRFDIYRESWNLLF